MTNIVEYLMRARDLLSPALANASRMADVAGRSVENINRSVNNVSRQAPGKIQRLTTVLNYLRERQKRAFDETQIARYNVAINKVQGELQRLNNLPPSGFVNRMKQANTSALSLTSAFRGLVAAAGAYALLRNSERAYKEEQVAITRLQAVMRNTMQASNEQVQSILEVASAQQKLGVIGDEVQLAGAQELATYLQKADSLKTLLPVMNDMLAQQYGLNASQEQAQNIATMLGKVMDGQVGALSRYGYKFDEAQEKILKTGTEAERVAVLFDVVSSAVGGVNAALAETPEGKLQQQANALGDMQEKLGALIIKLKTAMAPLVDFAIKLIDTFLLPAFEWIGKNADVIGQLAIVVLGAVVAYKIAMGVMTAWNLITKLLTTAQWGLNAALMANPVGLIIGLIAALIGYIVVAINKYDEFGASMLMIMGPLGILINAIMTFKRHWDSIVAAFKEGGIIGGLKRIGVVLLDTILYPIQQLLKLLSKIPGLGHLAAKGASYIEGVRKRLNLVTENEKKKEEKKEDKKDPQGITLSSGSGYDPGKAIGDIAGGGAKATNITINLNREMVSQITINPITMTQGATEIRDLLMQSLSQVLNSANAIALD